MSLIQRPHGNTVTVCCLFVFGYHQLSELGLTQRLKAFFEDSPASALGVVYRPEFESALRAHFQGDFTLGADPGWYALRKTVYASGCRIFKSKHTSTSFADIQTEAWSYFQCAMSVFTELLFTPSGLLAVRALGAMVRSRRSLKCRTLLMDLKRPISRKGSAILLSSICSVPVRHAQHKQKDYIADQLIRGTSQNKMRCTLAGCSGLYTAVINTSLIARVDPRSVPHVRRVDACRPTRS